MLFLINHPKKSVLGARLVAKLYQHPPTTLTPPPPTAANCFCAASEPQRRNYLRGSSSKAWLDRQRQDRYIKEAKKLNYRARSAFKLIEIDDKHRIFRPNQLVIDLGAAPGSWSQVAAQRTKPSRRIADAINVAIDEDKFNDFMLNNQSLRLSNTNAGGDGGGLIIGVDLLRIDPIHGCVFFDAKDFTNPTVQAQIQTIIETVSAHKDGAYADVIMSDMAPNATGDGFTDHVLILKLVQAAQLFADRFLAPDGVFICKLWHGEYMEFLIARLKQQYRQVLRVKPEASRMESSEVFLVNTGFQRRQTASTSTTTACN